jgi:CBS domain-containing protein
MPAVPNQSFAGVSARDVMRSPVVGCSPDLPLADVAHLMCSNGIHSVVVDGTTRDDGGEHLVWGVVSDLDLVRAAISNPAATAGDLAATKVVTVDATDPLECVAAILADRDCSHVIVIDDGWPVGVVSTLDIAGVLGAAHR